MKKFKVSIIFKNGIEKIIETESEVCEMENVLSIIRRAFRDNCEGVIHFDNCYFRISDASCINIEEVHTDHE